MKYLIVVLTAIFQIVDSYQVCMKPIYNAVQFGPDVLKTNSISSSDCSNECRLTTWCLSATFNKETGICYLHDKKRIVYHNQDCCDLYQKTVNCPKMKATLPSLLPNERTLQIDDFYMPWMKKHSSFHAPPAVGAALKPRAHRHETDLLVVHTALRIPISGFITEIDFYSHSSGSVTFYLVRSLGGNQYKVLGRINPYARPGGVVYHKLAQREWVRVQKGDLVAIQSVSDIPPLNYDDCQPSQLAHYRELIHDRFMHRVFRPGNIIEVPVTIGKCRTYSVKVKVIPVICTPPQFHQNTTVHPLKSTYEEGESVRYLCEVGYLPIKGDTSRHCEALTTWTGSPLMCKVGCMAPDITQANITILNSKSVYDIGDSLNFECSMGTTRIGGDYYQFCIEGNQWKGAVLNCADVCTIPDITANTSVMSDSKKYYLPGETVDYQCDYGFRAMMGDTIRVCQSGNSWTGSALKCLDSCLPPDVSRTNISIINPKPYFFVGETLRFACKHSTERISGDYQVTCAGSDTWHGQELICAEICQSVDEAQNAVVSPSKDYYVSGETITYSCVGSGIIRTGGDLKRTCRGKDEWSGTTISCEVACFPPKVWPGAEIDISKRVYRMGETVHYRCKCGNWIVGGSWRRQCLGGETDNAWTASPLQCDAKPPTRRQ